MKIEIIQCQAAANLDMSDNGWDKRVQSEKSVSSQTKQITETNVQDDKQLQCSALTGHYLLFCLFLTNKRCSHNHGVLVVGQLGDAVSILRCPEVKYTPHVLAFVVHWFGSFTKKMGTGSCLAVCNLSCLMTMCDDKCPYLLPVAIKSFLYSILRPSSKVTDRAFTSIATA